MQNLLTNIGKRLPLVAAILATGLVMAQNGHKWIFHKKATTYWVFNSNTTSDFRDASKYHLVTLEDPEDEGCADEHIRPCVMVPATGSNATASGFSAYLASFSNDAQVLNSAISTKS